MAPPQTSSAAAGPSSASLYSTTQSPGYGPRDDETPATYSSGYSSFPSAAQSPPTTASTMRPSLSGLVTPSNAPPPRQPIPFSHDDTDKSRLAYETLSASAKAYRVALGQLSAAASNFGSALEACARLKEARAQPYPPGPYTRGGGGLGNSDVGGGGGGVGLLSSDSSMYEASCTADVLLATSGLYYLIANQQGILAETVYRSFELPIVHELDRYGADVEAEQESYAAGMREASREIRRLEKEGHKLRKPRQRDVGRMRSHLVAMTDALDALTTRQGEHAVALLDQSRDMSGTVSQASRNLVRAEVDILDSLARKGWPGGGLDVVLYGAVDLFSRDGFDDDDTNGLGGSILLGGTSNGTGIVGSHAVVSGAGGILGSGLSNRGFAPKPLLAGTDGGVSLSSASIDDDLVDGDADDDADDDGGDEGAEIDDNESEVSTINGNIGSSSQTVAKETAPAPPSSGGGFFSMLTGGSILGRKTEPRTQIPDQDRAESVSSRRGRSPRKNQRSNTRSQKSQVSQQSQRSQKERSATPEAEKDEAAPEASQSTTVSVDTTSEPPSARTEGSQSRYTRADSLSIDPGYQHQYQSLDSLANVEAASAASVAGSDTASIHTRGASTSRRKAQKGKSTKSTAGSRGRSRPFSPQRVSVDPQEDLFTGQFSSPERTMSLAWLKEGEQLETPQEEKNKSIADGEASQGHEDEHTSQSSADKGKAIAPSPTASVPAATASQTSRESSSKPSPEVRHEETDEGVYIWRREG
ncbi:hypothetical protein SBRCBS47491_003626 [Sporothrix bragantina]|uniref:Phospholipid-binding protein n=1 Tax=Sporothrix bragantina TaxID=671064 RepID=A0ABP0BI47_9PEZI